MQTVHTIWSVPGGSHEFGVQDVGLSRVVRQDDFIQGYPPTSQCALYNDELALAAFGNYGGSL